MSKTQGINISFNKVVGLAISKGEEKKKLTIEQLLMLFEASSGTKFASDKAILSN